MLCSTVSDAFFGPICDYVIAPVVRYSSVWNIPVLTGGGQAENFAFKENFPVLTRMQGSFGLVGETMKGILHVFGWKVVGLLFHNNEVGSSQGNSPCYFTGAAVYKALNSTPVHHNFNENTASVEELREHLLYVTSRARISDWKNAPTGKSREMAEEGEKKWKGWRK
ncbi:Atrial natriuretic peptide receptor 3 [Frankliniella fusca]|uniref:Atrial natriuretic peptide receptor 3 n=1 Tax=Frankliniella fusca TaxID=407009 RepID=A0AAE1GZS0_9NEOP|nr:Atrial natriuretic peptide receptor 3 [Frankliniella fusca]